VVGRHLQAKVNVTDTALDSGDGRHCVIVLTFHAQSKTEIKIISYIK